MKTNNWLITTNGTKFCIDDEDYEKLRKHKWYITPNGYIHGTVDKRSVSLSRLLLGCPEGYEIDHIDRNPLNNQKANLRICTRMQNAYNQKIRENGTSQYRGISWDCRRKYWLCQIRINGKKTTIGCFDTEKDAARAYNAFAKMFHGDFATLNNLPKRGL